MIKDKIKIWGLLTNDAYFKLEEYPPHESEITLELGQFEKIVEERLHKLGIKFSVCKRCGKEILFLTTKTGKIMPVTCGLISHFADCPNANDFRKTVNK
jgi:hypothetical protein